jgi:hypothetical protein
MRAMFNFIGASEMIDLKIETGLFNGVIELKVKGEINGIPFNYTYNIFGESSIQKIEQIKKAIDMCFETLKRYAHVKEKK